MYAVIAIHRKDLDLRYIIGVDGGATKTEAVAYSLADQELAVGYAGFGNLSLDFDQAVKNIINAIQQCINSLEEQEGQGDCLCIYLGIAGIEVGDNLEKVETFLKEKFACKVQGFHDTELAYEAILKGEDGIITISGTGSVSYGLYKGKKARTGGWGHILGDEGSGYAIALAAFKRMTLEEDSGWVRSELTQTIMGKLNSDQVSDIRGFIYSASKGEIAAFAPIVAELAKSAEINSLNILKQAGKELAMMTERLYKKLGINESINIGVSGSILSKVDIVREEFKSCLERDLESVHIIADDISATKGACYLHSRIIEQGKY
ncbi:MAG: BadF/BadG/BcrA/BcrD ATPase family protein [Syntrophomonadaceae bacterium]|nr:BadF/BadG/BcrA/BcrD ATPase family protein [Syntrophomonadaceae bacterium]